MHARTQSLRAAIINLKKGLVITCSRISQSGLWSSNFYHLYTRCNSKPRIQTKRKYIALVNLCSIDKKMAAISSKSMLSVTYYPSRSLSLFLSHIHSLSLSHRYKYIVILQKGRRKFSLAYNAMIWLLLKYMPFLILLG